jgi:hypothetical protein
VNDEWRERLSEAATKFDGRVTNGSIAAQVGVIDDMLNEFVARLELISDQCLAGGHKSRSRMFKALAKSFRARYIV